MKGVSSLLLMLVGSALSACATPQQIDLIEREQRRLRTETTSALEDFDNIRSTLADTRANVQQMQRDLGALKEKVEEVRHQLDRQIGQSAREGGQGVQELEGRGAQL